MGKIAELWLIIPNMFDREQRLGDTYKECKIKKFYFKLKINLYD